MYKPVSMNKSIVCLEQQEHIFLQLKTKYPCYWLDIITAAHVRVALKGHPCVITFYNPETNRQIECPDFQLDMMKSDLVMSLNVQSTFDDDHVTRENISVYVVPRG